MEFMLLSLIAAPIRRGAEEDTPVAVALLRLMYPRPDMVAVCRRIVLTAFAGIQSLDADWAQTIDQA
jgi:hypothetical protein